MIAAPSRAVSGQMNSLTAAAAAAEQQFSSFAAVATTTGSSYEKLTEQAKQLARDFPIGRQAAVQVVGQFTQMGVAGKGAEEQIGRLSKTVVQLSGATGEGPQQLAEGMTNLARATGNTTLDPARFAKMADSVTKVSASAGASATSMLSFSKNIAPFAQSVGIGTTGILGISGAFARMGEDGAVASNAVSQDDVRPEPVGAYRQPGDARPTPSIVGMTADQYERLVKTNPTEASDPGHRRDRQGRSRGPRMLEQIGVEWIRGPARAAALAARRLHQADRGAPGRPTAPAPPRRRRRRPSAA